jgi:hypothetical protein
VTLAPQVPWLIAVGFAAQLIDGCVGMGQRAAVTAVGVVVFVLGATGLFTTLT